MKPGALAWVAIVALGCAWEIACLMSRGRFPSLEKVLAQISSTTTGRLVMFIIWVFLGVHFFARYAMVSH